MYSIRNIICVRSGKRNLQCHITIDWSIKYSKHLVCYQSFKEVKYIFNLLWHSTHRIYIQSTNTYDTSNDPQAGLLLVFFSTIRRVHFVLRYMFRFVKSNLMRVELGNLNQTLTEQNISRFSNNKLGEDVIVFLKHIQDQENGCVVMETVTELWMVSHGGSVQSFPVNVYSPSQPGGTIEVSNRSALPYGQLGDNQGVPRKNEGQGRHHTSNLYLYYSSSTWES